MFMRGSLKLYDEDRSICTSERMDDEIREYALTFRVSRSCFLQQFIFKCINSIYGAVFFPVFGSILIPAYLSLQGSPLLVVFHSGP